METQDLVDKIPDGRGGFVVRRPEDDLWIDESRGLEELLKEQAMVSHRWMQKSIEAEVARADFEKIGAARVLAHWHYFARLLLESEGAKETTETMRDATIRLFSETTDETTRTALLERCFNAELAKSKDKKALAAFVLDRATYVQKFMPFMALALKYTPSVTYESLTREGIRLAYVADKGKKVGEIFKERAFCLNQLCMRRREALQAEDLLARLKHMIRTLPTESREVFQEIR